MKALTIAATNLKRLFRWRPSLFFIVILPMLIILLLGAAFGGAGGAIVGVSASGAGPLGVDLVDRLRGLDDVEVRAFAGEGSLVRAVERGRVQAGLLVPPGYDATIRSGGAPRVRFLARPDSAGQDLRSTIQSVAGAQAGVVRAARFAEAHGVGDFATSLAAATRVASAVPGIAVVVTSADPSADTSAGRFDQSASSQLLLFVFLNSLYGAAALIETRKLGVSRRMLSTPTPIRTVLAGEGLGRFAVALFQGLLIMVGSLLLFGVSWGAPAGAAAVLVLFALVGCGAGMLMGATFRNEQQAAAVSLLAGLGLAAIGGSMVPLEVFPDAMRRVAHLTPHAWGNDAFSELVAHNGGFGDILSQLGVLALFAAALIALATWRLRITLSE